MEAGAQQAGTGETKSESGDGWENPLIPNERLRQIYLAMAQARALEKALPAAKRGRAIKPRTKITGTRGLEACLVSATVDLGPGDLVSDALAGGVVEYLRGMAMSEVLHSKEAEGTGKRRAGVSGTSFVCGSAGRLPSAIDATERIWVALGAAAALKAAAAKARTEAKAKTKHDTVTREAGVVVVYALPGEVTDSLWKKVLKFTAKHELPMMFVVLPRRGVKVKADGVSALALGCRVPAILVDADDAVAIYRVAQESIGHARIGGGAALIECVPFAVSGAMSNIKVTQDAIAGLERYMVQRGVATRPWMEREAKAFAKRVAG